MYIQIACFSDWKSQMFEFALKQSTCVTMFDMTVYFPFQNGTGDANDIWLVEVVGSPPGTVIQTAKSRLRFIHYHVRCVLHSHDKKLPKW